MAKIEWEIKNTEIDYSELIATYTGVALKNGKEYTDIVKYSLNQAMLESFKDSDMQQWGGFIQAVNELTGVTDWVLDSINNRVSYTKQVNSGWTSPFTLDRPLETPQLACETVIAERYPGRIPETVFKNETTNSINYDCYRRNSETAPRTHTTVISTTKLGIVTKYVSYTEITQKVISNTSSQNEGTSLLAEAYIDEVAKSFVTPVFDDSVVPPDAPLDIPDYVCPIDDGFLDYPKMARDKYTYMFDTPEFDALMQTIIEHRAQRQCEYLKLKKYLLDIDNATGSALDVIGKYLGQPRALVNFITEPYFGFKGALQAEAFNVGTWYTLNAASRGSIRVLNDELYRNVIKARIVKNNSSNGRDDLIAVLKLLGAKSFKLDYKRHGVISIRISNTDDPNGLVAYYISKYLDEDSIIPRQLGYRIGISVEKEVYMTSLIYPVYAVEGFESSYNLDQMVLSGFKDTVEDVFTSYSLESITERLPTNQTELSETFNSGYSMEGINITKQVEYRSMDGGLEAFDSNYSIESINITKQVSYLSTTIEPDGYSTGYSLETVQITN